MKVAHGLFLRASGEAAEWLVVREGSWEQRNAQHSYLSDIGCNQIKLFSNRVASKFQAFSVVAGGESPV